jgi:hypothetical protein
MRSRILALVALAGLTGCVKPISDTGVCLGLARDVAALRAALVRHPETPDAVGEAGTDVVIGFGAGCRRG